MPIEQPCCLSVWVLTAGFNYIELYTFLFMPALYVMFALFSLFIVFAPSVNNRTGSIFDKEGEEDISLPRIICIIGVRTLYRRFVKKTIGRRVLCPCVHRACRCLCRHSDCILCTVNTYSYTVPLLSCDCALVYMLMH